MATPITSEQLQRAKDRFDLIKTRATPTTVECLRDADQILSDITALQERAVALVSQKGPSDPTAAYGEIDNRASIARSEIMGIASLVENLDSEETRNRQVPVLDEILAKDESA